MCMPEFDEFTLQFYQNLMEDVSTEEEIVNFVLSPVKSEMHRARLRAYLDSIIQDDVSNEQLRKL